MLHKNVRNLAKLLNGKVKKVRTQRFSLCPFKYCLKCINRVLQTKNILSAAKMEREFLGINMTKDSILLLYANHSPFY